MAQTLMVTVLAAASLDYNVIQSALHLEILRYWFTSALSSICCRIGLCHLFFFALSLEVCRISLSSSFEIDGLSRLPEFRELPTIKFFLAFKILDCVRVEDWEEDVD